MLKNEITLKYAAQRCAGFKFPVEFFVQMTQWENIIKSPYSLSFYTHETDWNKKEDKSLRISDHWNFTTEYDFTTKLHCKTDREVPKDHWAIGQYDANQGIFIILDIKNPERKICREKDFQLIVMDIKYKEVINKVEPKFHPLVDYNFLKKYYKILEEHDI